MTCFAASKVTGAGCPFNHRSFNVGDQPVPHAKKHSPDSYRERRFGSIKIPSVRPVEKLRRTFSPLVKGESWKV